MKIKHSEKTPRLTALDERQKICIRGIVENTISLIIGDAGTGKSIIPLGLACEWLLREKVGKILIARPIVTAGGELGYFPGLLEEKIEPYFWPVDDYIKYFTGQQYPNLIAHGKIEYTPLQLMRGSTITDTFMILDEAQNATQKQLKLFLTRIGEGSKIVINGDTDEDQTDIPDSGWSTVYNKLEDTESVFRHEFTSVDIKRHPIIPHVLAKLK